MLRVFLAIVVVLAIAAPARAIDPPYEAEMERLAGILGSLYFLQPLCQTGTVDWREQMADLIALDEPDDDRRQRLTGSFNDGYQGYARLHRTCTTSAREALTRLLMEAEKLARDIHTRYAE
jgi:uncharacterized protein (TIGR02301 family)